MIQSVYGYSSAIHKAVCDLAYRRLDRVERRWIDRVSAPHRYRFPTGCGWPDWDGPHKDKTRRWHYQNLPTGQSSLESCHEGCLVAAIEDQFERVQTAGKPLERSEALYFLLHLATDLHQPLHNGRSVDRGGNHFTVWLEGKRSNFHRLWDSGLYPSD